MKRRLFAVTVILVVIATVKCNGSPAVSHTPTALAIPTASALPSRTPENSPRPAEAQAVITALSNAGFRLSYTSPSKFDWILGDASRRSGIFTGMIDSTPVRVDVLFLDVPAEDVSVCTVDAPGETKFTVRVRGTMVGSAQVTGSATGPIYFAMSDRHFVMSSDLLVRDALRDALGLWEPRC